MTQDVRQICSHAATRTADLFSGQTTILKEDACSILGKALRPAYKELCQRYDYTFRFEDVNYFRPRMHSELCLVELTRSMCTFSFPESWLELRHSKLLVALAKRTIPLVALLANLQSIERPLAVKFLFEVGDNGYLPAVSFCSKNNFSCLILDWDFFSSSGYIEVVEDSLSNAVPWDYRKKTLLWRGGTTGYRRFSPPAEGEDDEFQWLQRLWLCQTASKSVHRDVCDIAVSGFAQVPEEHLVERIKRAGLFREPVGKSEFKSYKGIVDIDGNSNAWSGLFTALLSGACVFKVRSERDFRQWYYRSLKPFSNYVPMAADFCDFDDALSWFRNNERVAQDIGETGRSLAQMLSLERSIKDSRQTLASWLSSSPDVSRSYDG